MQPRLLQEVVAVGGVDGDALQGAGDGQRDGAAGGAGWQIRRKVSASSVTRVPATSRTKWPGLMPACLDDAVQAS
jgi:hypothetical protein